MEHFLKSLFDISKVPAKFFVLFALVTGFILFASDLLLQTFHIVKIEQEYGEYVGIIFLVSTCMVIINTFLWFNKQLKISQYKKRRKLKVEHFIQSISASEQAVLREFIVPGMKTITAPIDDPTIAGMLHKDILYIAMSIGEDSTLMRGSSTTISIADDLLKVLNNTHLGLSGIPEDDLDYINRNRPSWVARYGKFTINES